MRLRSLLPAAVFLIPCLASRADTTTVFDLNSTFTGADGPGTVIGTITIDTTLGSVVAADLTASDFLFGNGTISTSSGLELSLDLPGSTLIDYTGSPICSFDYTIGCSSFSTAFAIKAGLTSDAVSGTLEPEAMAAAPEPSMFALLGTGLLGTVGLLRKKVSG